MSAAPEHVVVLNDYGSPTGGSSAVAIASALGLAARGVPTTYFAGTGPVAPALIGVPNLEVVCLNQPEIAKDPRRLRAFGRGWRNAEAVAALRRVLADKPPRSTVVHAHSWSKGLSPFAPAAAAAAGFPLVVTLHDFFIACPNGGFFVYPRGELCGRRPLSGACWACSCDRRNYGHKLWRNARAALQNRALRLPEKVRAYVGVSEFSLRLLRPHLPPGAAARVLRNPVEAERGEPAPVARNSDFVYVGRFEEEKGVRLFAEAARMARVPAVFVGDGALGPELRRLCPGAVFTGWLAPAEIRRRLRGARALAFPPLWYETLGLVAIEAAAAGVPAIVSDQCAAVDYVADGVNGRHFRRGSAEGLAAALRELADQPALAARLGRAAYEWYWRDPWSLERHVDGLLELYGEIVGPAETPAGKGAGHERAAGVRAGR